MASLPLFRLGRTSFLQQLTVTFTCGLLVISLLSSFGISALSYGVVRDKWLAQGRQSTEAFAAQSALALLYASRENAEEPAKRFLSSPDVRGVAIYNANREALLELGESTQPAGSAASVWPEALQLVEETEQAWFFAAPVFARSGGEQASPFEAQTPSPELIGYVRLAIGKQSLLAMKRQIQFVTLLVSGGAALVFFVFLLAMARRLTLPIQQLAKRMGRASAGEKKVRAKLAGPRDITDMGAAFNAMMQVLETREELLEQARDKALESARLKGEFAANVSHELRTPLNAVLGMLELLQDMGLTPKQLEYSTVARNAGEALLKLIEDILDFSRIEAGMLKCQPSDFVLHETLDEVVELMAAQARRKNLRLSYTIGERVPAVLHGEAGRVRQVLINLVGNALKFTEQGAIELGVEAEAAGQEPLVLRFSVADTGLGIPATVQNRIFDAFVQADGSSTRHYEGAGLGLAICRQLVQLMGGRIGLDSRLGHGSRFWFSVPFATPRGSAALAAARRECFAELRILLVTDNEQTRSVLASHFDEWQVEYRHSGFTGRMNQVFDPAPSQGQTYRLIVADIDTEADWERIEAVAAAAAEVNAKIILLHDSEYESRLGDLANLAARLAKPVNPTDLYGLILNVGCGRNAADGVAAPPVAALPALALDVLVVEDNRAGQMVAAGMLERLGCRYQIAASGAEALQRLASDAFDVVLMDCHMPGVDGFEATRRIRAWPEPLGRIPIIAMTANALRGDEELCRAAGMDDFLPKPIKLQALRQKLIGRLENRPLPLAAASDAAPATLDPDKLAQLRAEIGGAYGKMLRFFLEDAPAQIEQIAPALRDTDLSRLRELAHGLKGAARNVGAEKLAAMARQLELAAETGALAEGSATLAEGLLAEFRALEPLLRAEIDAEPSADSALAPNGPRVLVADDDRVLRVALQDILQQDGYSVDLAVTGRQAVALCARQMADLILMDAMMPEMDGFAACKAIRALPHGAEVPILMITALENEHSVELAFATGANDFVPKPIHFTVLRKRIAHLLKASQSQRSLNQLAYHDTLTNLPNRVQFMERLNRVLAKPAAQPQAHAVLFLDLDRFKLTNDTMGHDVGDMMLKAAAERIQGCVRREDMVSRFGGDEFILLLEHIGNPQAAAAVAQKICNAIAKPFALMGQEFYISSSIGISLYPYDGKDSGLLVKHADTAMYRAKEQGNTFCFYEQSMEYAVSSKLRLESDLRRALQRREFFLHYQPQIDLDSGRVIGAEALIRWRHPELGMISPDQFIPVAEEIGLIDEIGAWVLREACRQNRLWQQNGYPPFVVAVNVSAKQLDRDGFAEQVIAILHESGLAAEYLELELTESLFIRHPEQKREILARLKAAGMQISIDDFGTGYSSLNQLKHFVFDKLKIDKSFVANIMHDADAAAIVRVIISIAGILKFEVIAEGVETAEQASYLRQNHCKQAQGYLFGKPMPAEEFSAFIGGSGRDGL
ncbi:EAL domain-containing protein [Methylomonas koyamae]|uniref:Response regulator receiver protein n=1 Tax=Methylomonas koyamae TaxID=702114 RepID=A0A291IPJ8_9GAMM|nr:EAL domain-containing protein [Methylomonas koyamae]ATG92126.1 response regulator receiver protein [Methylomonas koyamae]OAI22965.1 response regulator receiver protein [Methylomonas koyamae]